MATSREPRRAAGEPIATDRRPSTRPSARGATSRSLRETAYDAIKADILGGTLYPGAPISEAELADSLRTSRTPIREALQVLAQEGLVEIYPKRGTFVARLTDREIRESFELREAVETACARLAAERRTDDDLEGLRASIEAAHERRSDERQYGRLADFHHLIVVAARNRYLEQAFEGTASRIDLASRLASRLDSNLEPDSTHDAVYQAILAGDGRGAEEAMRRHLRSHAEALLRHLR